MEAITIHYKLSALADTAAQIWDLGKGNNVWVFEGEMGAGKTTLISALCKQLGVSDSISSPTYSIINEYQFKDENNSTKTIFHSDWYRLKDTNDAREAGVEDILYQTNAYAFVEWASRAADLLNKPFLLLSIRTISTEQRCIEIRVQNRLG